MAWRAGAGKPARGTRAIAAACAAAHSLPMPLFLTTLVALIAFAANSILNRAALAEAGMDPGLFTTIRLLSGALVLAALVQLRSPGTGPVKAGSIASAAALFIYAIFFSYAYVALDAGVGALILFGGVQITMFAGSILAGNRPSAWRWAGSVMGLAGLGVLFLPGAVVPEPLRAMMMLVAAVAWGIYSLRGAGTRDPLAVTAANFVLAAPAGLAVLLLWDGSAPSLAGVALAVGSGAVASGMGYAIWYSVLPRLDASLAAIAQLTVPLIALGGGIAFLGEGVTLTFALAAALILGGVALAVYGPRLRAGVVKQ